MNNATFCTNAYKSSQVKDSLGNKYVVCQKTKKPCVAQRFCGELNDYIVSENANRVCKNYNK